MRPQIVKIYTTVLSLFASTFLFAATSQGPSEPPPPTMDRTTGPELPIDSNLYLLAIAALVFGVYIAYKRHKAKNVSR
ncbi:MAG: hypothetical protein R3359_07035 [Marinirhabdus sp.]|nr:hypothetical protein [Marinirhabdus sp.]